MKSLEYKGAGKKGGQFWQQNDIPKWLTMPASFPGNAMQQPSFFFFRTDALRTECLFSYLSHFRNTS